MKKSIWILCLALAIAEVLFFKNSAHAVLNISNNVVQDSNTGLEWLVMSQTVNKSPDRIMAGDYGLKAAGWVHATISQIETLFLNAGMTGPFNGTNSPWNFDAANHLIALLGNTGEYYGEYGRSVSIQAFSASLGTPTGYLTTPVILVGDTPTGNVGGGTTPGPSVPSSVASPTIGNWLVRTNPAISAPVFNSDSATLTNTYLPFKVGDILTSKTYGFPFVIYGYAEAIRREIIDQVTCLKIKDNSSYSSTAIAYYWVAQDTSGSVWLFQSQDVELNELKYYGKNYAKMVMPSKVSVGSVLYDSEGIDKVVATGITVANLSTGLGPYYNCIKTEFTWTTGDIEYHSYAPGVGPIKEEWNYDGGINGIEISEIGYRPKSAMPWLPLLLED